LLASERAARNEAERASRLKDEFLGTLLARVAHAIELYPALDSTASGKVDDAAQITRGLTAIERSTRTQAQLISDLLDVSR
jgi:hypothetical protein